MRSTPKSLFYYDVVDIMRDVVDIMRLSKVLFP